MNVRIIVGFWTIQVKLFFLNHYNHGHLLCRLIAETLSLFICYLLKAVMVDRLGKYNIWI